MKKIRRSHHKHVSKDLARSDLAKRHRRRLLAAGFVWGCLPLPARADTAAQIRIARIEQMADLPQPFAMRDWKQVTRDYDVTRILNWSFNGDSACRPGWGLIVGSWGGYDVGGLEGSITDGQGYAFAMNTFELVAALAPLPRYDARYARAIGKLILNTANAARLFYTNGLPPENQTCYDQRDFTGDAIAYEGLRRVGLRLQDANKTPCACGDPLGGRWGGHEYISDFSLYGSSHVGLMAAAIERTDDEKILQLNCLKTDFFHARAYPTYLYYNPYGKARQIRIDVGSQPVDLYDTIRHRFVSRRVTGKTPLRLAPDSTALVVIAPAGGIVTYDDGKLLVNGVVVDYHSNSSRATANDVRFARRPRISSLCLP